MPSRRSTTLDANAREAVGRSSQFEQLRVAVTKGTVLAPASCMSGRVAARRALVVEDDGQLRAVVAEYLRGEGFAVDEAGDGGAALSAARDAPPDVLVLDMQMPAMDGAAVLAGWNESSALKEVPVVVVSAAPNLPEITERFDVRATLVKPFDLDVLRAVVEQVLTHRSSRQDASV